MTKDIRDREDLWPKIASIRAYFYQFSVKQHKPDAPMKSWAHLEMMIAVMDWLDSLAFPSPEHAIKCELSCVYTFETHREARAFFDLFEESDHLVASWPGSGPCERVEFDGGRFSRTMSCCVKLTGPHCERLPETATRITNLIEDISKWRMHAMQDGDNEKARLLTTVKMRLHIVQGHLWEEANSLADQDPDPCKSSDRPELAE